MASNRTGVFPLFLFLLLLLLLPLLFLGLFYAGLDSILESAFMEMGLFWRLGKCLARRIPGQCLEISSTRLEQRRRDVHDYLSLGGLAF